MKEKRTFSRTTRKRFVTWTLVALSASAILGGLLFLLKVNDGVAIFNLWVDVVIGIFTIWGLAWAASEFAESSIKPEVKIMVGGPRNPPILGTPGILHYSILKGPLLQIKGWRKVRMLGGPPKRIPNLACGLYLINEESRAGRYARVAIRIYTHPKPSACEFAHSSFGVAESRVLGEYDAETESFTLEIQFSEQLVIYQSPAQVGELFVHWEEELVDEKLPSSVVLDYDVYTLDGASAGKVELSILEWE